MSAGTIGTMGQSPTVAAPQTGACAWCEDVWPVEDLAVDANLDSVCVDCRSTDCSADDAAACRSYMYAGR